MGLPEILAGIMLVALIFYAILGGADFGGGIWDWLATGPRAKEQRDLIDMAIAPVWEANHVWLILIIVILFTGFPLAFSTASVLLHIPLTLVLIGIVLRGSAFVFRKYDVQGDPSQRHWGHVFAVSSAFTPFFLGLSLGAITSGRLEVNATTNRDFLSRFVLPWLHPFPIVVGFFGLCLFAFLAAIYLTVEAHSPDLQNDFRKRALGAGILGLVPATATAMGTTFPELVPIREKLMETAWTWIWVLSAVGAWIASLYALYVRRYTLARVFAVGLVALILCGWAFGQYPYLIRPTLTIQNAAAPAITLKLVLLVLALGALLLLPSMVWLFRVFKRRPAFAPLEEDKS